MNILIAGDLVVRENNLENFKNSDLESVMGDSLLKIWEKSDYKFFNLEAPITSSNNKIQKSGPNLKIDISCIPGIKSMNPTCIFLSNNHILDYDINGLLETQYLLDNNEIDYIGIGNDLNSLKKSYIIEDSGIKIALYNCCEHEFSGATENSTGANEFDSLLVFDEIKKLKEENDYVIIVYHGGKEYYRYPSPKLQKKCHKMIDAGADIVTCQHSHCIGCMETYNEKSIIYGQGNFIFDGNNNEYWNTSIILNILVDNGIKIEYIPIVRTDKGTRIASEEEKEKILDGFFTRTNQIRDVKFVKENYNKFSEEKIYEYLIALRGNNAIDKVLRKIFGKKIIMKFYNKKSLLRILNYIECEAHNELLIEGLKEKIYESKNKE